VRGIRAVEAGGFDVVGFQARDGTTGISAANVKDYRCKWIIPMPDD